MTHPTQPGAAPRAADRDPTRAAPPALVIAGHGTRVEAGAAAAAALVDKIRAVLPDVRVEAGFVELTPPTIEAALDAVLTTASAAVVVPLMIGAGGHVREDIPEAVDAAAARDRTATIVRTRHLGAAAPLLAAVHARIATARGEWLAAETDVVLVGRGCSVTDANADHVRLCRVAWETGAYRRVSPAFIQVTQPSLRRALDEVVTGGGGRIVVMPHFLFPGRLEQWVHDQVGAFRANHPEVAVRVADVIGACDELAEVVAQRYREGALQARTASGSPAYLTGLLLRGRRVVVVGGGCVARRRVPKLLAAGARVDVIAPIVHRRIAELADEEAIVWHARQFQPSDLAGAWYVLALTSCPETNAAVVAAAEARHLFCVRADQADDGSAWTPATGDTAGVTVAAIASHDPLRARRARDRLLEVVAEEAL